MTDSVWEVSKAGQIAARMPLDLRLQYAGLYDSLENFQGLQMSEREVWFAIGDFAGATSLPAPELARLDGLVSRAAAFDEALNANYDNLHADLEKLGVTTAGSLPEGMTARKAICRPFAPAPAP